MDNPKTEIIAGGLYVRGVVVSSSAKAYQRKDGSGTFVRVQHELATQPGVVLFEQYLDPKESTEVKIEDGKVVTYPRLPEFASVTLKVLRYRLGQDRLVITEAEPVGKAS